MTGVIKMDDRITLVATWLEVATSDGNKKWRETAAKWTVATIATTFHKLRIYWKRRVQIAGDAGNCGNLGNGTGEPCQVREVTRP